jgi:TatD DNase family protein
MILTDTHTHLYLDEYNEDIQQVIERAIENKVGYFLLPNIDSSTIVPMNSLCNKYKDIMFPMIGLHPTSVKENYLEECEIMRREAILNKYFAIGEIGIDLYWDLSFKAEQEYALKFQLELAMELNLPVSIHSRSSLSETIEMVKKVNTNNKLKGVFHCFGGTYEEAIDIIDMGFLLGIGGVVTFKNSGLDKVLAHIDLDNIILETDSPYLTPSPFRGKRNESSFLVYIARKISELKKISVEEVAEITTNNARRLFNF